MENTDKKASSELNFAQIAWVTKDVERAKTFFQEVLSVSNAIFASLKQDLLLWISEQL